MGKDPQGSAPRPPQEQRSTTPAQWTRRGFGILGLAAVTGGAVFAARWFNIGASAAGAAALTAPQAHAAAAAGEITLIDIRRPDEWRRTGIGAGAIPIDMRRQDFVAALLAETQDQTHAPIALICARGVRSARVSAALTKAGFSQIIDVPEGMLGSGAGPGWLKRRLPVTAWNG